VVVVAILGTASCKPVAPLLVEQVESDAGQTWPILDSHLHFYDFIQQTDGFPALVEAMDAANFPRAIVFGMPIPGRLSQGSPHAAVDALCRWGECAGSKVRVTIPDHAGNLPTVVDLIAREDAAVVDVRYDRLLSLASAKEPRVVLTVETHDRAQVDALLDALKRAGVEAELVVEQINAASTPNPRKADDCAGCAW